MDWFLYDRDLPHERIKKWASLDPQTEANIVGENLFIVLIDFRQKVWNPFDFFCIERNCLTHFFHPTKALAFKIAALISYPLKQSGNC